MCDVYVECVCAGVQVLWIYVETEANFQEMLRSSQPLRWWILFDMEHIPGL